jgi:hypothetical protein
LAVADKEEARVKRTSAKQELRKVGKRDWKWMDLSCRRSPF